MFFPGLDLHTRCCYRFLPTLFRSGRMEVLDAGCGNGALSYAAYRRGGRVLRVSCIPREVEDTTALFDAMRIPRGATVVTGDVMATYRVYFGIYRRPHLLPRALDSALRQSFPDCACGAPQNPFSSARDGTSEAESALTLAVHRGKSYGTYR